MHVFILREYAFFEYPFQTPLTEEYIVQSLPTKKDTFTLMLMSWAASSKVMKPLGDFEVQFAYDPVTLEAVKQ